MLLQEYLRRVGVRMDVQTLESTVVHERLTAGDFEAAFAIGERPDLAATHHLPPLVDHYHRRTSASRGTERPVVDRPADTHGGSLDRSRQAVKKEKAPCGRPRRDQETHVGGYQTNPL